MEPSNSIFQLPGTETSYLWVKHFSVINWKLQIKLFWVLHLQIINSVSSLWTAYIRISLVLSLKIGHVCVMYWVLKICFTLFLPFNDPIRIIFFQNSNIWSTGWICQPTVFASGRRAVGNVVNASVARVRLRPDFRIVRKLWRETVQRLSPEAGCGGRKCRNHL